MSIENDLKERGCTFKLYDLIPVRCYQQSPVLLHLPGLYTERMNSVA
jgi:hypothetical protein